MYLTELRFGMYIIDHRWMKLIDFNECMMRIFFTGVQKIIRAHYGISCQSIIRVQLPKQCIILNSNLINVL